MHAFMPAIRGMLPEIAYLRENVSSSGRCRPSQTATVSAAIALKAASGRWRPWACAGPAVANCQQLQSVTAVPIVTEELQRELRQQSCLFIVLHPKWLASDSRFVGLIAVLWTRVPSILCLDVNRYHLKETDNS